MRKELKRPLRLFCLELMIYAAFVAVYFLLVLHFLGGWLKDLFESDRPVYAVVALGLIVGQGFLLEVFTRLMLALIDPSSEAR